MQDNKMQVFKSIIRVHELLVQVYHGYQKFNHPMKGVHQNGVHRDIPRGIITMDMTKILHPSLQPMVAIPHKEHTFEKGFQIKIGQHELFKPLVL
jgi:hypothetical protein